MEKVTSFTINHLKLKPGIYVSRIDHVNGNPLTTFDLRMTTPNKEPVMNTAEVHTIEHLGATCEEPEECVVRGLVKIVSDQKYKHLAFSMKNKILK